MDIKKYATGRKIAIWGTAIEAVTAFYQLCKEQIIVDAFFDNGCNSELIFLGKKVFRPSKENIKEYYIVVACKYQTYFQIEEQLKDEYQFRSIVDFVYYKCINRKIIILHGNCHTTVVREYLESVETFVKEYAFYPNPTIQLNKKGYIDSEILKNCDVLLIQDIREDNKFGIKLSGAYLKGEIDKKCLCITIPNLFSLGKAFFPLTEKNYFNDSIRNGMNKNGIFPKKIVIIDELLEKGYVLEEIIHEIQKEDLLSEQEIKANFDLYMSKIQEREKLWDIKIYDFIIDNYKKYLLFYDSGHPTNIIIKEIVRQILNRFDIYEELYDDGISCMDTYEEWILPCVKKSLQLEYDIRTIRNSSTAYKLDDMDIEEYVKQYIFYKNNSKEKC